jgi:hypothetical protein
MSRSLEPKIPARIPARIPVRIPAKIQERSSPRIRVRALKVLARKSRRNLRTLPNQAIRLDLAAVAAGQPALES